MSKISASAEKCASIGISLGSSKASAVGEVYCFFIILLFLMGVELGWGEDLQAHLS